MAEPSARWRRGADRPTGGSGERRGPADYRNPWGFQARLDAGPPSGLPRRRAKALLAYLALPPERVHPRDKLAALLWGDLSDEHARQTLRQALATLRRVSLPSLTPTRSSWPMTVVARSSLTHTNVGAKAAP